MVHAKQNLLRKTFFILLLSIIAVMNGLAQNSSNSGTDFYVAFGRNNEVITISGDGSSINVQLLLRITAFEDTDVTLSFTDNTTLNETFFVKAGTMKDYQLSASQVRASYLTGAPVTKKSIHVTATNPITLVAVNATNMNMDATLVWPVESYGTEYYNIGIPPSSNQNCNGYIIIAKENGTTVTQTNTPSGTLSANLNAGDVYYYWVGNADAMGAHIESNKPVAFFQSGTKSLLSATSGSLRYSHTFEQFLPTSSWGTRFILPSNELGAAYARIYAKKNTVLHVYYTDNSHETFTIPALASHNVVINGTYYSGRNAAYITTDQPVGIATYHIPKIASDISQPSEMWLPPLDQSVQNFSISPLDLNATLLYTPAKHYFMIVVPTAGKEQTTISLNGGQTRFIQDLPDFTWVADNIGNSGYSVGRYYFGESHVVVGEKLNTTAFVSNPNGMIAMAWGQFAYASYSYTVGSAYRDLTASFTVNGESHIDMDGKAYCHTSNFEFIAQPDTLTSIIWKLNGEEIAGSLNAITAHANNLPDGYYTVDMTVRDKIYTTHFWVGGSTVIWTPQAPSIIPVRGVPAYQDWHNPFNWTPFVVPSFCHNVIIPGDCSSYPLLEDNSRGECKNIYFMQGAELGRPDLLTYEKAFVQYNFGLKQSAQHKDNDKNLVLESAATDDRMQYSAAVSSEPLERERWYLLSSPLRGVVTGDLGFGGFPLTFLKKFGPIEKDSHDYSVGNWTTPYNSMTEFVSTNATRGYIPTGGFAFYMYGAGNKYDSDAGCDETGLYDADDLVYLPSDRDGKDYGIKKTNGILELPFFTDSAALYAHRTQVYDFNESTFYYINDGINNPSDFNKLLGKSESVNREIENGNYRFAPEEYIGGDWVFRNPVNHQGTDLGGNDEFLVGNPYLSSIDMEKFLDDNIATVKSQFKVWNGTNFISYSLTDGEIVPTYPPDDAVNPGYIAPMQGFLLTTADGYDGTGTVATFDVENISAVRPVKTPSNLRSAQAPEENIIRIKAENDYAASYAVIGYKKDASNDLTHKDDVQKLFSPLNYVPEIYSLAGKMPADINFVNNNGEVIIPLGISTRMTEKIQLTFTGMDNYFRASKIELFDAFENCTIDLTGMSSYTYVFTSREKGIQNGRFSLRMKNTITDSAEAYLSNDLKVFGDSNGIYVLSDSSDPVQKLEVYDFQGRKMYESNASAGYYPLPGNTGNSPLIVKVVTKNQVKSVKMDGRKL